MYTLIGIFSKILLRHHNILLLEKLYFYIIDNTLNSEKYYTMLVEVWYKNHICHFLSIFKDTNIQRRKYKKTDLILKDYARELCYIPSGHSHQANRRQGKMK